MPSKPSPPCTTLPRQAEPAAQTPSRPGHTHPFATTSRAADATRVRRAAIRCTEVPSWYGSSATLTGADRLLPCAYTHCAAGQIGTAGTALQTMTAGSGAHHMPGAPTRGLEGPHTVAGQRWIPTGFPLGAHAFSCTSSLLKHSHVEAS